MEKKYNEEVEARAKRFGIILASCGLGILVFAIISGVVGIAIFSMNEQERNDCNHWAEQARVYPGFFLTQWQADQCKAHDIVVNAPIKL